MTIISSLTQDDDNQISDVLLFGGAGVIRFIGEDQRGIKRSVIVDSAQTSIIY